jgi:hypothetical protein
MAGRITVSTLNDDTGVLATQNGMSGIAKAWVNFNPSSGSSAVIRASFNVSSVTYVGTGNYTINFATSMPDTNYTVVCTNQPLTNGFITTTSAFATAYNNNTAPSAGSFSICTYQSNGGNANPAYVFASVFR